VLCQSFLECLGCERDRGMRSPFLFGSGGSVQHSQSPMNAGYDAVIEHPSMYGRRRTSKSELKVAQGVLRYLRATNFLARTP
jgi:hypothetical protein